MTYSFQTFSALEVLGAAKMNQVEVNIRDHIHGQAGVSAVPETPVPRNTVQMSARDSQGYPSFLSAGTGLALNLAATSIPLTLAFASGFDSSTLLPSDVPSRLSLDVTGVVSGLAASNTNYISTDYTSSSAVAWNKWLVPPMQSFAFDRSRGLIGRFEGTNGATTTTDDFGNTMTLSTATITTAQARSGTSSLDCTGGASKYWETSDIKRFGGQTGGKSWEFQTWVRFNALGGAGTRATILAAENTAGFGLFLYLFNNAGTRKLELYLSSDGKTHDVINGTVGANTTWNTAQWHKVRIQKDALGGKINVFLSLNGAAETLDIQVASSAVVCGIAKLRCGRNILANTNQLDGWFDDARYVECATNTSTETPSASAPSITDTNLKYNWYSLNEEISYEVTGASSSAGTNPSMTTKQRVFVGEADTSGAAVSVVRHYPIRQRQFVRSRIISITSGAGTYLPTSGSTWFKARLVGGGSSGRSINVGIDAGANAGSNTTFSNGTVTLTATGGSAPTVTTGGEGGIPTATGVISGSVLLVSGGDGKPSNVAGQMAGNGGGSFFGDGGKAPAQGASVGNAAKALGAGGGGGQSGTGGSSSVLLSGSGGSAGGYIEFICSLPLGSPWTYSVGAGGASPGGDGAAGAGKDGALIIEEFFD